ncbi:Shieldin complex subunit 2 [Haplosporangium sp. Z 767]|nr:Shieldin complex subunit 2 [Haplosporangium sp. Z 767]
MSGSSGGVNGREAQGNAKQMPTSKDMSPTTKNVARRPYLKRDYSDIIPAAIPTQEVLQNPGRYRSVGPSSTQDWSQDLDKEIEEYEEENHEQDTTHSVYDDTSPVIPSLTPARAIPPLSQPKRRVGPSFQPQRPTLSRAPEKPDVMSTAPTTIEVCDDDPITDFDDSDDGNGLKDRTREDKCEPIISTLSALASPFRQQSLSRSPYQSPSRRIVHPLMPNLPVRGSPTSPTSPSKRLRPLSELVRPIVLPPNITQRNSSPVRARLSPRKQSKSRKTRSVYQPTASTATRPPVVSPATPTRSVSAIGRSIILEPPSAPLGPKLQQIAEEMMREREQAAATAGNMKHDSVKEQEQEEVQMEDLDIESSSLSSETETESSPSQSPVSDPVSIPTALMDIHVETPEARKRRLLAELAAASPWLPLSLPSKSPPTPALATTSDIGPICVPAVMVSTLEPVSTRADVANVRKSDQESFLRQSTSYATISESSEMNKAVTHQLQPQPHPQPPFRSPPQPQVVDISKQKCDGSSSGMIPLPTLILEYASKLTPMDAIKWHPVKEGRFHVLGLVIYLGPVERMMSKTGPQTGQVYGKLSMTVCDQSTTSFKIILWRDKCQWVDEIKAGDVVLITDLQIKEFRNRISGNTSSWSKMSNLDGSTLGSYRGSPTIESYLRIFVEKRRILALDLLDADKSITSDPSFYLTQPVGSFLSQNGPSLGRIGNRCDFLSEQRALQFHNNNSESSSSSATAATVVSASRMSTESSIGQSRTFVPMAPSITGMSVRASVAYKMLMNPGDDDQGWEIGAVMSNGRHVKVQCGNASLWISTVSPGRLLNFFGKFEGDIFQIGPSIREPILMPDNVWGNSVKRIEPRCFSSIKSMRQHKFMGDAFIEGYILAVNFPDLSNNNDGDESDMFGFIQCYCTGCHSVAVSSPQNPSILFCPHCHLDPQRRAQSTLEWMYPSFELSVGDKARMSANVSSECLQVRCQFEVGDQVFLSVPARRWMQDEEGFWKCQRKWKRLVAMMNGQDEDEDVKGVGRTGSCQQRLRIEARVGVNMVIKALNVAYL